MTRGDVKARCVPEDVTTLAQAAERTEGTCPTEQAGVGAASIVAVRAIPTTPGPAYVEAVLGPCSHTGGKGTQIDMVGHSRRGAVCRLRAVVL